MASTQTEAPLVQHKICGSQSLSEACCRRNADLSEGYKIIHPTPETGKIHNKILAVLHLNWIYTSLLQSADSRCSRTTLLSSHL